MKNMLLKTQVQEILLETMENRKEFAMGYKAGQENYHDKNMIQNWEESGHPEDYKKGYLLGVKDAKRGETNNWVTKFLVSLGNMLNVGHSGNRDKSSVKWKS